MAKCGRNAILDNRIHLDKGVPIRLSDLEMIQQSHKDVPADVSANLCQLLKFHNAKPSSWDKLRLHPVKRLVNPAVIEFLLSFPVSTLAARMASLGRYLKVLNCLMYLWNNPSDDSKM